MKTEEEKALGRIKKCLRLSSSSNPHEAAAALRQAQILMEKFNIDHADVHASDAKQTGANANVKSKPTKWENQLAWVCADAFCCKLVFNSGTWSWRKGVWEFIGTGSSSELAAYAFEVLLRQLKRDRAEYIATTLYRCKVATKTARADVFCLNWANAVSEKVGSIAPTRAQSTAIVAFMEKHYTDLVTLKNTVNKGRSNSDALHKDSVAGWNAGKNAGLHHGVGSNCVMPGLEQLS